jgi:hypothetical protein
MRLVLPVFTMLVLLGCSRETAAPTAPTTPAPPESSSSAYVWVMVAGESGVCIPDATVQVVAGQARGQSHTQTEPCDVWGYGGGITFNGLTPGTGMTLRASAPGYTAQERAVVPSSGPVIFVLSRTR